MQQRFQIETISDYLDFFIRKADDNFFSLRYPKMKIRILQNCYKLKKLIEDINEKNFFHHMSHINCLESEIWILLEFSELAELYNYPLYTEEELLDIAQGDCKIYFKEKCGMNLLNPTPHSIHFTAV